MARVCPQCRLKSDEKTCPTCKMPTVDEAALTGEDLVGRVFAERYEVQAVIGRGGMGAVYRALNRTLDSMVALKVLRREAAEDLEAIERFYREARAASKLKHVNSIKVFDFGQSDDGRLFLAMEYLEGRSLRAELAHGGRMAEARILHIAEQVCKALGEAHSLGIVHRDIKPENVFLTQMFQETDFVKVLDYGIARTVNSESLTRTGTAVGTPKYMSPEQGRAERVDGRSDLYSLGIVMYELASGDAPFQSDTPVGYILCHINDPVKPLHEALPGAVSPAFSGLVATLLAKTPDGRPKDAEAVLGLIAAVRRGEIPDATAWAPSLTAGSEEIGAGVATPMKATAAPQKTRVEVPAPAARPAVTLSGIASGNTSEVTPAPAGWSPPMRDVEAEEKRKRPWPFALVLTILFLAIGGFFAVRSGVVSLSSIGGLLDTFKTATAPAPAPTPSPAATAPGVPAQAVRARVVSARLTSTPPGARVFLTDGSQLGTTPMNVLVTEGQGTWVRIVLTGWQEQETTLTYEAVSGVADHEIAVALKRK